MPTTMNEVRAFLDPEEPDYVMAANLGADALPHLAVLVRGDSPMLASKAAYLSGLIGGLGAGDVLDTAAHSDHTVVRVAAAAAVQHLDDASMAERLVPSMLADLDDGVRKQALRSTRARSLAGVKAQVEQIAQGDRNAALRDLASEIAAELPD